MADKPSGRGAALQQSREDRFDSWFRERRWRVRTEVSGPRENEGAVTDYDRGEFWVRPPEVFQTPLGHTGRHGVLIRETDPATGRDLDPPVDAAFGFATLSSAVTRYSAVSGLSEPRKAPPAPTG